MVLDSEPFGLWGRLNCFLHAVVYVSWSAVAGQIYGQWGPEEAMATDQPDKTSTVRTSTSYRSTAL